MGKLKEPLHLLIKLPPVFRTKIRFIIICPEILKTIHSTILMMRSRLSIRDLISLQKILALSIQPMQTSQTILTSS